MAKNPDPETENVIAFQSKREKFEADAVEWFSALIEGDDQRRIAAEARLPAGAVQVAPLPDPTEPST